MPIPHSEADTGSGRPQLTITKDTTLKISWGALVAVIAYIGYGSWWLSEIRQIDRSAVRAVEVETNRQIDALRSDSNYISKTLTGYTSRVDRIDDGLQEMKLVRHRLEQNEHSYASQDRRMAAHEVKLEEVQRKTAEHAIIIDYILRWINPMSDVPQKKRNELAPLRGGRFGTEAKK